MPSTKLVCARRLWNQLSLTLLLILSGCTNPSRSEVVGTYNMKYMGLTFELTLTEGSTYIQNVEDEISRKRETFFGKWTYDSAVGDVKLDGTVLVLSTIVGSTKKRIERHVGVVLLPAARRFGRLRLGSDEGEQYIRQR
jgi:hypothetical protein